MTSVPLLILMTFLFIRAYDSRHTTLSENHGNEERDRPSDA